MKELGYSSDEAESRITAMRIIKAVPQAEDKVKSGKLSMTHLKLAQNFFNTEKRKGDGEYSSSQKLEFLETLCETSTREAQRIIFQESTAPQKLIPDRIKEISNESIEFRFVGTEKLKNLIDQSKGLLAHKHPGASLAEIMEMALERLIEDLDPSKIKPRRKLERKPVAKQIAEKNQSSTAQVLVSPSQLDAPYSDTTYSVTPDSEAPHSETFHPDTTHPNVPHSEANFRKTTITCTVSVPKVTAREVYAKAQNRCENCGSVHALQIEHIKPRALGGTHDFSNLKILCRNCNQRQAVKVYGAPHMEKYLS